MTLDASLLTDFSVELPIVISLYFMSSCVALISFFNAPVDELLLQSAPNCFLEMLCVDVYAGIFLDFISAGFFAFLGSTSL